MIAVLKPTPVCALKVTADGFLEMVSDEELVAPLELVNPPVTTEPLAPSTPVPEPAVPAHLVYRVPPVVIASGPVLNVTLSVDMSKLPVAVMVSAGEVHEVEVVEVFVGALMDCGKELGGGGGAAFILAVTFM